MKLKKLLALALAGVMVAVTLTACAPLDDLYDWFFGSGSSASRGNGTGLMESEALEESIIQWFGLSSATREKNEAEPMLEEVAKRFDPESWYNDSGELNGTAQAVLDTIAQDKLTLNGWSKHTCVDVWEVQPSQAGFAPSPDRRLYEDAIYMGGASSNIPTHFPRMQSYGNVRNWIQSMDSFDLYASVFQKNGKTYAAMALMYF